MPTLITSYYSLPFTCAAVSVRVQLVTRGTLAAVASWLIGAVVFTATIVHNTLINVCKQAQVMLIQRK